MSSAHHIIRWFLHRRRTKGVLDSYQPGDVLFHHLRTVDSSTFQSMFDVQGADVVLGTLGRYHEKYSKLPPHDVYESVKVRDARYVQWFNKATAPERAALARFEQDIFAPLDEEEWSREQVKDFLYRSFCTRIMAREAQELALGVKSAEEIFKQGVDDRSSFMSELERDLAGSRDGALTYTAVPVVSGMSDEKGYPTLFPNIRIYKEGVTCLLAPAKKGKTTLLLSISRDLADRGWNVIYLDLENGLQKLMRRQYQGITASPKAWVERNFFVDASKLPHPFRTPFGVYLKGDRCCRWRVVRGVGSGPESIEVLIMEATCNSPSDSDWKEVGNVELSGLATSMEEELTARMNAQRAESGGNVYIERLRNPTPARMEEVIEYSKVEFGWFEDGKPVLVVVDWGQHMRSDNKSLKSIWEVSRDNYAKYKDLRENHGFSQLIIEAPAEPDDFSRVSFDVASVKAASNRNIIYDVEAAACFLATEEEHVNGYGRLVVSHDRDGAAYETSYVRKDYDTMRYYPCQESEHRARCPKYWMERGKADNVARKSNKLPSSFDPSLLKSAYKSKE